MKYRVWWWIKRGWGNREMEFRVVNSVEEAKKVLKRLASRDLKNKSITVNGGGLEVYNDEDGDWEEYYDSLGRDIWEIIEEKE